jgi:hypothetical protein
MGGARPDADRERELHARIGQHGRGEQRAWLAPVGVELDDERLVRVARLVDRDAEPGMLESAARAARDEGDHDKTPHVARIRAFRDLGSAVQIRR